MLNYYPNLAKTLARELRHEESIKVLQAAENLAFRNLDTLDLGLEWTKCPNLLERAIVVRVQI